MYGEQAMPHETDPILLLTKYMMKQSEVPFYSFEEINKDTNREISAAFQKVVDSDWYILGNEVVAFEKNYAEFNQVKYCAGVANGLDALSISLKVLNIGSGDEIIV